MSALIYHDDTLSPLPLQSFCAHMDSAFFPQDPVNHFNPLNCQPDKSDLPFDPPRPFSDPFEAPFLKRSLDLMLSQKWLSSLWAVSLAKSSPVTGPGSTSKVSGSPINILTLHTQGILNPQKKKRHLLQKRCNKTLKAAWVEMNTMTDMMRFSSFFLLSVWQMTP